MANILMVIIILEFPMVFTAVTRGSAEKDDHPYMAYEPILRVPSCGNITQTFKTTYKRILTEEDMVNVTIEDSNSAFINGVSYPTQAKSCVQQNCIWLAVDGKYIFTSILLIDSTSLKEGSHGMRLILQRRGSTAIVDQLNQKIHVELLALEPNTKDTPCVDTEVVRAGQTIDKKVTLRDAQLVTKSSKKLTIQLERQIPGRNKARRLVQLTVSNIRPGVSNTTCARRRKYCVKFNMAPDNSIVINATIKDVAVKDNGDYTVKVRNKKGLKLKPLAFKVKALSCR